MHLEQILLQPSLNFVRYTEGIYVTDRQTSVLLVLGNKTVIEGFRRRKHAIIWLLCHVNYTSARFNTWNSTFCTSSVFVCGILNAIFGG